MAGARMMVAIDLAARAHAPLASHPLRLQLRVAMLAPRADGLRDGSEADALFQLEDRLVPALEQTADALFVYRILAQGFTHWVFYVPAEKRAAAEQPLATVGPIAPYRLDWFVEEDASWEQYGQLFPDRYAMQIIMNRRLLQRREEAGDRAELPRPIDHAATFRTRAAAETASIALAARGFEVRAPVGRDDGSWLLELVRVDVCAPPRPDEVSFEILQIIEPLDGDYDGWGAIVVTEPPR